MALKTPYTTQECLAIKVARHFGRSGRTWEVPVWFNFHSHQVKAVKNYFLLRLLGRINKLQTIKIKQSKKTEEFCFRTPRRTPLQDLFAK